MELKGFYSEETLRPLLYEGEISTLEFLFHCSEEDYQLKVEERDHIEDSL